MRTLGGALVLVLCLGAVARAEDESADISAIRPNLVFVTDGKGHYLAHVPFQKDSRFELFYSNDGVDFYKQRVFGTGANGDRGYSYQYWEPRTPYSYGSSFYYQDGKYFTKCLDRQTELKRVADADAQKLLAKANFKQPRWKRMAYALARDTRGVYYYVDRAREPPNNLDFRLYVGQRGKLKLFKMKNIVSDTVGDIFATAKGELRLVINKGEALWVKGKKETTLTTVPIEDAAPLIYTDLGVYTGQPLGTPCDEL